MVPENNPGAVGAGTNVLVDIRGRAKAGAVIEIFASKDRQEFRLIGSARTLPITDPILQPMPAPDGRNWFNLRAKVDASATYIFRIRAASMDDVSDADLAVAHENKGSFGFSPDASQPGTYVTQAIVFDAT